MDPNTIEDPIERRRAQIRASVARHKVRMGQLTRLEQAAYKARASLGPDFKPYTAEERAKVDRINELIGELERSVDELNSDLVERLSVEVSGDPRLSVLLGTLVGGEGVRIIIKPF